MNKMITFGKGNLQFNYRSVGVVTCKDKVLLHRSEKDNFWSLPGGRVEFLESCDQTIIREMKEELNVEIKIKKLIWVVENFFDYDNKSYHELAFYFMISFPNNSPLYSLTEKFESIEEGLKLTFKWFEIDKLDSIELYPEFLKKSLKSIPESVQHVVCRKN